jgi:hypothetical protein
MNADRGHVRVKLIKPQWRFWILGDTCKFVFHLLKVKRVADLVLPPVSSSFQSRLYFILCISEQKSDVPLNG